MLKVEKIEKDGKILAMILRSTTPESPVEFVTPKDFPLQLGIHKRKEGEYIKAHEHKPFDNLKSLPVQEILFIKKGKISIELYHKKKVFKKVVVSDGEVILLNSGHNVRFLEDTEMTEVKQGPYREKEYEKIPLE